MSVEAKLVDVEPVVQVSMPLKTARIIRALSGNVSGGGEVRDLTSELFFELSRIDSDNDETFSDYFENKLRDGALVAR